MLVLSRRRNESILIGEDVEITIAAIDGRKVRLGISAPRWVPIVRKEIYQTNHRKAVLVK